MLPEVCLVSSPLKSRILHQQFLVEHQGSTPRQISEVAFSVPSKHGLASKRLSFFPFIPPSSPPFSKPTTTLGGQRDYKALTDTAGADYFQPASPCTLAHSFPPIQILNVTRHSKSIDSSHPLCKTEKM